MYFFDGKAEFSAAVALISPVLHDPSEIILICWFSLQKHFLILSMLKTVELLNMFVETLKNRKFNIYLYLFETELFGNINIYKKLFAVPVD